MTQPARVKLTSKNLIKLSHITKSQELKAQSNLSSW